MRDPFVVRVARALSALRPPGRLLVAVSGGADSVALLEAAAASRYRADLAELTLVAGHVDHQLRRDSAVDRDLAAAHAARLQLPFVHETVRVDPRGAGLEAAARRARYAALRRLAEGSGCEAVLTGHTATDQAETMLWRLCRGTGARGLGGIAPRRRLGGLLVLRPMLGLHREEARAFCERAALAFRDDPTNEDARPRARLRAEVLPVLERLAPGAVTRMAQAADRLREDERFLEREARRAAAGGDEAAHFAALAPALRRRALARWAASHLGSRRRISSAHLAALEALVLSGRGEVDLPAGPTRHQLARVEEGLLVLCDRPRSRS